MKLSGDKCLAILTLFAAVAFLPSCGMGQQLQFITVSPSGFVSEAKGATGQFTAYGNFIHPPEKRDITNEVVWSIDVQNLATLTQTGLATSISLCGSGNVTATWYNNRKNPTAGSVVVGYATFSTVLDGTKACGSP